MIDADDEDAWPFEERSDALSMESLRILLDAREPLTRLDDLGTAWRLGSIQISKLRPERVAGFTSDLTAACVFRKQWFHFPDIERSGWAVIFRVREPRSAPGPTSEYLCGWVPPAREADADRWVAFLNAEIDARLSGAETSDAKP